MLQTTRQKRLVIVSGCLMGGIIFCACLGLAALFEWSNYKSSALRTAIQQDDASRVEAVLNEQPDVIESKNKTGQTPLIYAIDQNKKNAVEALIRRGADVKARWQYARDWDRAYHYSTLQLVAGWGNVEIAELLLNAGADINEKSEKGQTALDTAIEKGQGAFEKFLRDHGGKLGSELPKEPN